MQENPTCFEELSSISRALSAQLHTYQNLEQLNIAGRDGSPSRTAFSDTVRHLRGIYATSMTLLTRAQADLEAMYSMPLKSRGTP